MYIRAVIFSKYSLSVKCYLFKTCCSNIYCALLWYNSKVALSKEMLILTGLDD